MAGTTTAAYTADVWTSPSTVDGSQNQWDYAVPVRQNVSISRSMLFPVLPDPFRMVTVPMDMWRSISDRDGCADSLLLVE